MGFHGGLKPYRASEEVNMIEYLGSCGFWIYKCQYHSIWLNPLWSNLNSTWLCPPWFISTIFFAESLHEKPWVWFRSQCSAGRLACSMLVLPTHSKRGHIVQTQKPSRCIPLTINHDHSITRLVHISFFFIPLISWPSTVANHGKTMANPMIFFANVRRFPALRPSPRATAAPSLWFQALEVRCPTAPCRRDQKSLQ